MESPAEFATGWTGSPFVEAWGHVGASSHVSGGREVSIYTANARMALAAGDWPQYAQSAAGLELCERGRAAQDAGRSCAAAGT